MTKQRAVLSKLIYRFVTKRDHTSPDQPSVSRDAHIKEGVCVEEWGEGRSGVKESWDGQWRIAVV